MVSNIKKITMSLYRLLVLVLIICGSLNAQTKVNKFNTQGERIGAWEKNHKNGNIRYKGQFENGKEIGVFKFYSQENSEIPIIIKEYFTHSDVAKVQFFTKEGKLQSDGELEGKNRTGKWTFYYDDGTISSEENYIKGELSGVYKLFYENGTLAEFTHFKEGKLDGKAVYYNLNGAVLGTGSFANDEKIGEWEYFEDGDPSKKSLGKY